LSARTSYTYSIVATDAAGNMSAPGLAVPFVTPTPPDLTPPSAPANLTAAPVATTQVSLSWSASSDNVGVTGYQITRNGQPVTTIAATSFTDRTAAAGTTYAYAVSAFDAAGNVSTLSNVATATTSTITSGAPAGFAASYFKNTTLAGVPVTNTASTINFNWGTAAPVSGILADNFSARYTGRLTAPTTGTYTFYTDVDDGARLWVNGKLVIDQWGNHQLAEFKAAVSLTAKTKYSIKLEYYDSAATAVAKLLWSGPGIAKAAVPSSVMTSSSNGLTGTYFSNATLTGPAAVVRLDPNVSFDWSTGSPDSRLPVDKFSVRWTGVIVPDTTAKYTFTTLSADGVRLWINNQPLVNNWTAHAALENSGSITLNARVPYAVRMEYEDLTGSAVAKLSWSSPSIAKSLVPPANLTDR
jgi:chitodextrinase